MDFGKIRNHLIGFNEIESQTLRDKVASVWQSAFDQSDYDDLVDVPFSPRLLAEDVTLISHQNDVTAIAIALVDSMVDLNPGLPVDRDSVIAGALLHDVSKLVERQPEFIAENDASYLPHPYYAIYLLGAAGLSPHLHHIVLAHSHHTPIKPATIEASIVQSADELAASSLLWMDRRTLLHRV